MDSDNDRTVIQRAVDAWTDRETDYTAVTQDYRKHTFRKIIFILVCIAAAFIAIGISVNVGDYHTEFLQTYKIIWGHIIGDPVGDTADYIIWKWRMPRILTGILAGAGLAAAGAVMQSILRNPLADPYTTGISSGASFGATLALALGLTVTGSSYAVVVNAFIFALIPTLAIILVAKMKSSSPTTMIMAGIAIMYIFNAMATLIRLRSDTETQAAIFAWSVGTIDVTSWTIPETMFVIVLIGIVLLQLLARKLNVLATGDESARSIGVNPETLRIVALLIVSLLAAGIVSFTGLIGFIGLVCPHIARLVIGSDNRFLIPASAAFGAALLLVADIIGRSISSVNDIQVGVITAFIGGPMFLYLILKQKKEAWR